MTIRNRATLRNYFGNGKLPTTYHFGDLVDSMLNMSDEGFKKSPEYGIELTTPVGHHALMSFYRDQSPKSVVWSVGYSGGKDLLHFHHGAPLAGLPASVPVLALDKVRVGINTANPRHTLDVAGVMASQGRLGTHKGSSDMAAPLADGDWHDISGSLSGCQAFEVVAGVGNKGSGRFSLLHAIAMNTYNPSSGWLDFLSRKKRIRTQNAHYGRRCDKLQLSWEGSSGDNAAYRLRIRTGCNFGKDAKNNDIPIKVFVTKLWFDEHMQDDTEEKDRKEPKDRQYKQDLET